MKQDISTHLLDYTHIDEMSDAEYAKYLHLNEAKAAALKADRIEEGHRKRLYLDSTGVDWRREWDWLEQLTDRLINPDGSLTMSQRVTEE